MKVLSSISYNVKQGFKGILSNKTMSFMSIGSVSASLVILGIVIAVVLNVNQFMSYTKDEVNEIRATISDNLSKEEKTKVKEDLSKISGVNSIKYKTKESAFDDMKDSWGEDSYLLDGMDNPLEDYFVIRVEDSNNIETIGNKISKVNGVEEINYYQDIMENFMKISSTIQKVGGIIIACLFVVCLFMISNTIRSRVYSKREEIKIMKYVGASNNFVRAPFLIEGFTIGIIGAIISSVISIAMYVYVYQNMGSTMSLFSTGGMLVPIEEIGAILSLTFLCIGMIIGIIGSAISIKKHLRV